MLAASKMRLHGAAVLVLLCCCSCVQPNYFSRDKLAASALKGKVKPFYGCETSAYPPNNSTAVPRHTVDLSLQPRQRWIELVTTYKQQLLALVGHVHNLTEELIGHRAFNYLIDNLDKMTASLPALYREEMEGVATASGLSRAEVTLYNIFYELFTYCTSIVMQDADGRIYHGRNLDFGLFMGWNTSTHQWKVAELLRPLVVQVAWLSNDKTLFTSVNYVGYVGIITAVKKGAFSLSIDERFSWNGGFVGLLEWMVFGDHEQRWLGFLTRDVMANARTYEEAKKQLAAPRLLAPVYFILAGTRPGEGCIITRFRDGEDTVSLNSSSWFLVQTNYDHWSQPPFYDDRRTPAVTCLKEGRQRWANGSTHRPLHHKSGGNRPAQLLGQAKSPLWDSTAEDLAAGPRLQSEGDALMRLLWPTMHRLTGGSATPAEGESTNVENDPLTESSRASQEEKSSNLSLLYNVLSTRPVLNKLTTYTSLMSAADGTIDTWLRHCQDPCWPW